LLHGCISVASAVTYYGENIMSLITSPGKHGLSPIAKWSLIISPILYMVGGILLTGGEFGLWGDKLVGAISAQGETAKLGAVLSVIAGALYVTALMGLTRITPQENMAFARMQVATMGTAILTAIFIVWSGIAMAIAAGDTGAGSLLVGIDAAAAILFFLVLIPLSGGFQRGGIVNKNLAWVVLAIGVLGFIASVVMGANDETGKMIISVLQGIHALVLLVIGIMLVKAEA
jgi:hypothetical protein